MKKQVESWVRHNRDAVQTPRVFDPNNVAKTMEIVAVERSAYKERDPKNLPAYNRAARRVVGSVGAAAIS